MQLQSSVVYWYKYHFWFPSSSNEKKTILSICTLFLKSDLKPNYGDLHHTMSSTTYPSPGVRTLTKKTTLFNQPLLLALYGDSRVFSGQPDIVHTPSRVILKHFTRYPNQLSELLRRSSSSSTLGLLQITLLFTLSVRKSPGALQRQLILNICIQDYLIG